MKSQSTQLHVVLEHFVFDQQEILDQYLSGQIDFEGVIAKYYEQS